MFETWNGLRDKVLDAPEIRLDESRAEPTLLCEQWDGTLLPQPARELVNFDAQRISNHWSSSPDLTGARVPSRAPP